MLVWLAGAFEISILNLSIIVTSMMFVLLAGMLTQVERKFLAMVQQRVGPSITGHRGLLQFAADALKVLMKEVIYLRQSSGLLLASMPILFFMMNLWVTLVLSWGNNNNLLSLEYDMMVLFLVMAMSSLIVIYTGFFLKNKYTQLSSNSAVSVLTNLDMTLGLFISYLMLQTGSFSFDETVKTRETVYLFPLNAMVIMPLMCMMLMDAGKAPFDLVEAETELMMGFFMDYSGFLFMMFLLGEYLHLLLLSYLLCLLLSF